MMQRSETGAQKTDFRLVHSYIPFAEMITRAILFAALALQIRGVVSGHVFLTLVFLVVYVDLLFHMGIQSSAVGIHLIPVAFMLTTADRQSIVALPTNVHVALDMLWACVCVAHYTCSMMRVHSPYVWFRVALIAASVLVHMPSTAYSMTQVEVYLRILFFYTFCFIHYHVFLTRVPYDTNTHTLLGPNVNLYILFVHPYAVLLAVLCKCSVMCKMHFEDCGHKRDVCIDKPAPTSTVQTHDQEMLELMMELRAAQNSKV